MVIDKQTGQTPPTAAERMDLHDRKMGVEPIRPAKTSAAPDMSAAARAESGLSARPAPAQRATAPVAAPKVADSSKARVAANSKRPWSQQPTNRPALKSNSAPARVANRPLPQSGATRQTIVTGKWWDAKGPRTIELSPKGQVKLSGGFITLFVVTLIAAIIALVIEPILLFVAAFLLFRFGSHILGPIGAAIVDKALAERD